MSIRLRTFFILILFFTPFALHAGSGQIEPPQTQYQRVVTLKPNITQMVTSLGLAERIVGITKYCPLPNNTARVVADYNSIDIEAVVRLKPDLVLTSFENSMQRQVEALRQVGVMVILYDFRSYAQMKGSLLAMADLMGVLQKGEVLIAEMDAKLARLSQKIRQDSTLGKTFILIVQRRPLIVATNRAYLSSLLETAGLKNIYAANQVAFPVLDEEEFIREIADYTFDLTHDPDDVEGDFLNKQVIPLNARHFLAAPQSVDYLEQLLNRQLPPS